MNYEIIFSRSSQQFRVIFCVAVLLLLYDISFSQVGCAGKIGALPSIVFKSKSIKLLPDAEAILESVASTLKNNPGCKTVVSGYCSSSKNEQQRSWDLVNNVIKHLVEKQGISADRLIFSYGNDGDCNLVDMRVAAEGEEGPSTVPPPHPALRNRG